MEGKPDWLSGFPVQIYCNRAHLDVELKKYQGHQKNQKRTFPTRTAVKLNVVGKLSRNGSKVSICPGF